MNNKARLMTVALISLSSGCASAGQPAQTGVGMTLSCSRLFEKVLADTTPPPNERPPTLLNGPAVSERLGRVYHGAASHEAVVDLWIQSDGKVSGGCVPNSSGDPTFDRAALMALQKARFRPAHLNGAAVDAWVEIPITPVQPRGREAAPAPGLNGATAVWIDTDSGAYVYYCPRDPGYGTTEHGRYMSETEARNLGYRPAGGQGCGG